MGICPSHLRDSAVLNGLNHFHHENDQCRLRQELHLDGRFLLSTNSTSHISRTIRQAKTTGAHVDSLQSSMNDIVTMVRSLVVLLQ